MKNSERNLMAQINRLLAPRGERLHKSRSRWINELGRYHVINDCNWYCGPAWLDSEQDLKAYLSDLSAAQIKASLDSSHK